VHPALYLLYVVAVVLTCFLVPGMLVVRLAGRDEHRDAFFGASLAVGLGLVCYLSLLVVGLLGLVVKVHVSLPLVVGLALALTAGAGILLRLSEGSFAFLKELFVTAPRTAFSLPLFLYLAAVTAVALLVYDSALFDQERCVSRAGILPFADYLTGRLPVGFPGCIECFRDRNAFFLWNGGQREGPAVLVANAMALFGFPGFRIMNALLALVTGWLGFHLGRQVFESRPLGYLTSAALVLNPMVLSIPLEDENTMALALGTALFFFLFRKRPAWALVGLFAGLFLGIRHEGVVSLAALAIVAWTAGRNLRFKTPLADELFGRGRVTAFVVLGLATVAASVPWIWAHAWLFSQTGGVYESFLSMPATEHRFLGIRFPFNGLLSWPFVPEPVRSPYNGFPTLVSFPLTLLRTWGILLCALGLTGVAWGWRNRRVETLAGAAWLLPALALLMVMANWVQPNKMGVFLCFSQPVALAMAAGVRQVGTALSALRTSGALKPALPTAGVLVASVGLLAALPLGLRSFQAPLDQRNFGARVEYIVNDYPVTPPMVHGTEEAYAALDRQQLAALHLFPDFFLADWFRRPELLPVRSRQVLHDFAAPYFRQFADRAKDLLYGLSGLPEAMVRSLALCRHEACDPSHVTLDDMMHHPVGHIRDDMGGTRGLPQVSEPPGTAAVPLVLDLSRPLVTNPGFLAPAPLPEALPALPARPLVATAIPIPWADGQSGHFAMIPFAPGYYWIVLWFGDFTTTHLDSRTDISLITPGPDLRIPLSLPDGAVVRITEATTIEPSRLHVWTAVVRSGNVAIEGPVPSSY
jgi:hypothetical protein